MDGHNYTLLPVVGWVIFPLLAAYFIVRLDRSMNRFRVLIRAGAMFRDMTNLVKDVQSPFTTPTAGGCMNSTERPSWRMDKAHSAMICQLSASFSRPPDRASVERLSIMIRSVSLTSG